ncbi:MAG: DUF3987 domain-containing protein [Desulfobacterales bacterium]|jgi:hypothetical protein|nr:DUF3987 domain-containing protein [Desulfobacterales bacterium]
MKTFPLKDDNSLGTKLCPCPSFDTGKLPKKIQRYVDSIVATTDAEPIMIVVSVLCMVSAFVKHSCFIPEAKEEGEGYFQTLYPNLWTLCVSRSGSFKTTALNKGFNLAYEHDSGNVSDLYERANKKDVILPNRTTSEGLLEDLVNGHAGAIICSEFGAWLQTLERSYNQGLKQLFTHLYDVPSVYSSRTKSGGRLTIREPFITICGVSTVEWVKNNIGVDDISSGFFARFLIFFPPHNDRVPPALPKAGPVIEREAEKGVKAVIESLQALPGSRAYRLNAKAKEAFEQLHKELYEKVTDRLENSQRILEPYLKRWSPYVLKIAMLLQLFVDECADEIGMDALNGAIAIMEQAVDSTIWLFENDLGESPHQKKVRKVRDYIFKRGGSVSRRQLIQSRVLEGGSKDYDYVLQTLEESGNIVLINTDHKNGTMITLVDEKENVVENVE